MGLSHIAPRPPAVADRANGPRSQLTADAVRRGVQYLAFRRHPGGLSANFAPGSGAVAPAVAQAALAAISAHEVLDAQREATASSAAYQAAMIARARLAEQLDQLKSGVTRAPTTAARGAYLDALADIVLRAVATPEEAIAGSCNSASKTPPP